MYLYNLTVQRAKAITHAIQGHFSGTKSQEIVISKGKCLELLTVDPKTGKVHTLITHEVFDIIRSLVSLRLTGALKDYIVLGLASGRIVILSYIPRKNVFEKLHQETYGNLVEQRFVVTGQYLATDPGGKALLVAAIESQKLGFVINQDDHEKVTVSLALEAERNKTILYHMVALDVGICNPIFACLQVDYEDDSSASKEISHKQQQIAFYELDLIRNQVLKKYSELLDGYGNLLIAVPGRNIGPSGVLICSENYLTYMRLGDQPNICCPIPRRANDLDDPMRGIIFVCSTTYSSESAFFFLAQTEQGDIFKITLEIEGDMVTEIKMKYFDTVPVSTALCVLKTGLLFVAAEFGNHYLYQIANLGDDDDELEFSSAMTLEEDDTIFFVPRPLRNMVLVNEIESLSPIMSCHVADLAGEDAPQLYMLCGRGPRSSLRVLRHGLEVSEMGVSELPGNPIAVWTVKRRNDDEYDAYIIVSFLNGTLVLSIGETVEEVTDSGFLRTTSTLLCAALNDDALIQVYPDGIICISEDKVNEWKAGKQKIVKCVVSERQVVVALSDYDLVFLEIDLNGHFHEYKDRRPMNTDIVCMALNCVKLDEQCSWLLVVGLADGTIHIISFDTSLFVAVRATHPLQVGAQSLCIVEHRDSSTSQLFLFIGLIDGTLIRTVLDPVTGSFSETRTQYLGPTGVKLFKIKMHQCEGVLALSNRSWLSYHNQSRFHVTPLSYDSLEYASGFNSEQCPEGIVAISANTLRILTLEKLGEVFSHVSFPLEYTPRKFVIHPQSGTFFIIETDHNAYTDETKRQRRLEITEGLKATSSKEEHELSNEMASIVLNDNLPETIFTAPKPGHNMWASILRVMDPTPGLTFNVVRLEQNEAAVSLTLVKFRDFPESQWFLVVGVAKNLHLNPPSCKLGFLDTYQVDVTGKEIELVHRIDTEGIPTSLCAYDGRLLAGVGNILRLYDMEEKKLITVCETDEIPNAIVNIQAIDGRIFVSDVMESVFMVCYSYVEKELIVFADDMHPRWITCTTVLDYDTIACADKFGNIVVLRVPFSVTHILEEDTTEVGELAKQNIMWKAASLKFDTVAAFHVGEIVTSLQKTALKLGGRESIIYTTLSGTLGMLIPFTSQEDHEFFQQVETLMRNENPPISGRDHLSFRSYYFPVRDVIDGDICEQYHSLDRQLQNSIAASLNLTPAEVSKKLEDIRTYCAFS